MYLKKLTHPEYFQGNKHKKHYFEGWYYKFVSHDESVTLALIPGVSLTKDDTHAFIQVFLSETKQDQPELKTYYFRYDYSSFHYHQDRFQIQIGNNTFTKSLAKIILKQDDFSLEGSLKMEHITPIKSSLLVPNIMGFFGYFSFMECYHGVVSMSHQLTGSFIINNQPVIFENGKGYIEKDWGKSFPKSYVWLQSNHFTELGTSMMFSYATIPFLKREFKGLIANVIYRGKEYRFATYNFTKVVKKEIEDNQVSFTLKKRTYRLEVKASTRHQINLVSPRNGKMIEQIKEGMSGIVELALYRDDKLIFRDLGNHAGIEIMMK